MPATTSPTPALPTGHVVELTLPEYTVAEAAVILKVSKRWLAGEVAARRVPHSRRARKVWIRPEHIRQIQELGDVQPATSPTRRRAA